MIWVGWGYKNKKKRFNDLFVIIIHAYRPGRRIPGDVPNQITACVRQKGKINKKINLRCCFIK